LTSKISDLTDSQTIPDNADADLVALNSADFKARLLALDLRSDFKITYSLQLENVVRSFLKTRKKSFERLLVKSNYYKPLFENIFVANYIPSEIKYMAIVESAFNVNAVSKMGATGIWQFMKPTAQQYGVLVNSYVDNRRNPMQATIAAAVFMNDLFKMFGDWSLVLAAYNCGSGNVQKAIKKAGGKANFESIAMYFPKETQAYIPAFLATMYVCEYATTHGIRLMANNSDFADTHLMLVDRAIDLKLMAISLGISVDELRELNPDFNVDVIPFNFSKNYSVRVPSNKLALLQDLKYRDGNNNYTQIIFDAVDITSKSKRKVTIHQAIKIPQHKIAVNKAIANLSANIDIETALKFEKAAIQRNSNHVYVVLNNESLRDIALKFNMTEADLHLANNLKYNTVVEGQKLVIQTSGQFSARNEQVVV
jgi:membrane-bound lytic murein transglycosylase D